MLPPILASNFNLFEGIFWITLGLILIFLVSAVPNRYKTLVRIAIALLITFGISDFLQNTHGSFLSPGMEWLLLWKITNLLALIGVGIWYVLLRRTDYNSTANSTETGQ